MNHSTMSMLYKVSHYSICYKEGNQNSFQNIFCYYYYFAFKNILIKSKVKKWWNIAMKACINFFIYFIKWKQLKNYEKCFLFYLQLLWLSRYLSFCSFPLPFFSPAGKCWIYKRSWLKINRKVFDAIMCLNWNFKTQIV